MKLLLPLFIFISILLVGCKKKNEKEPSSVVYSSSFQRVDALVENVKLSSSGEDFYESNAYFFEEEVDLSIPDYSKTTDVGELFANGIHFGKTIYSQVNPSYTHYDDTSYTVKKPCEWRLLSNNNFPSFTVEDVIAYPNFDVSKFPDTLHLSHDSLSISNIQGATSMEFEYSGMIKNFDNLSGKSEILLSRKELLEIFYNIGYQRMSVELHTDQFKVVKGRIIRFRTTHNYLLNMYFAE